MKMKSDIITLSEHALLSESGTIKFRVIASREHGQPGALTGIQVSTKHWGTSAIIESLDIDISPEKLKELGIFFIQAAETLKERTPELCEVYNPVS
jgi:hypothetical protein